MERSVSRVSRSLLRTEYCYFIGLRDQLLIAFWRALRELQGRYDPSEYERRWKEPFPTREMEVLTQRMKDLKRD
jgi:hypothetical protein